MKRPFHFLLILPLLLAGACIKDQFAPYPPLPNEEDKSVMLKVSVPSGSKRAGTRSIGDPQENTIETLDVLAFKMVGGVETFQYWTQGRKEAENIEGSATQSFNVKLRVSEEQQRFVVVTNARSKIMELIAQADWGNANKEAMLSQLEVNLGSTGRWKSSGVADFAAMPMWGESPFMVIENATTTMGTISMLRMVAKIEVQLDDEYDPNIVNKFKLKSVHIYNVHTRGRIVPKPGTEYVGLDMKAVKPSIPDTATIDLGPLAYAQAHDFDPPGIPDVAMRGAIYLFEREAINSSDCYLDETCIVVGGLYDNDIQPSYYRIDFVDQNDQHIDILRNHNYFCNIMEVKGRGYPTVDEAYRIKSYNNIVAKIIEWDDRVASVAFDDHFVMSLSKDDFEFYREATDIELSNNVLYVYTDYQTPDPGSISGWYVEKIVDRTTGLPVSWLHVTPDHGNPGNRTKAVLTYEANYTGEDRAAVIWIAAGRMRIAVKVSQSKYPPIKLEIVDANNKPIRELVFHSLEGERPAAQGFSVIWEPYAFPVAVHSVNLVGKTPFDPASGIPTLDIPGGGTGVKTYQIQPSAITSTDILSDPFIEKASMVTFLVNNGPNNEAQSIFLRQLHYNLVVDHDPSYLLDGLRHTIYVKSNAEWRIKSVVETSSDPSRPLLDLQGGDNLKVGTMGGYNILGGDLITFTVTNGGRSLWGKVEVVFENTETPKLFDDKKITLIFALPRVNLVNFCSSAEYNLVPTNNNTTNAGYMLANGLNFGIDETSKVYSRGFNVTSYTANNSITQTNINNADIVVVVYNYTLSSAGCQVLADYVLNGGVLLFMSENNTNYVQADLFRRIFPGSSITISDNNIVNNKLLQLSSNINDAIINGPFGDLRGLYVGTDAGGDRRVNHSSMPAGSFTLYADYTDYGRSGAATYHDQSAILRLNDYPMIHICDGGFFHSNNAGSTTGSPFVLSDGKPFAKSYGNDAGFRQPAHNAALFGNMMVWAIRESEK